MKLVVIYGAPATGKYTIARLAAEKTGLKFFHNHLSIDVVRSILPFGAPGFFELSRKIRLDVIEEAAKQNISLIFTYVYAKGEGEEFVQSVIDVVNKRGGEIQFIQLYCDADELVRRVKSDHRKSMKKIDSPDQLLQTLEEYDLQSAIPNVESAVIDSTNLTVEETLDRVTELIG